MRAGRLNRKVTLESPSPTRGAGGALVEGWATIATVWAALEPAGAKEAMESGKVTAEVSHRIIIRHRTDVTPRCRVSMSDTASSPATTRRFRIVGVINPRDGRQELHLMVLEKPDGEPA